MEGDGWDCGLFTAVGGLCSARLKGVDATRSRKGGHQDATAALVLLTHATRLPRGNRETRTHPAAPDHARGDGDDTTSHQWSAGRTGSVAGDGVRGHRRGGPGAREGSLSVEDQFVDEDLAEECGVDEVNVTITGRVTLFTFPDGRVLQDLTTINLEVVWTAGDNEVRVRDVGIDQVRVQPDGTVILSIVGQVLFGFTGVLKINDETGEVILEPHHFFDIEDVCAQLSA